MALRPNLQPTQHHSTSEMASKPALRIQIPLEKRTRKPNTVETTLGVEKVRRRGSPSRIDQEYFRKRQAIWVVEDGVEEFGAGVAGLSGNDDAALHAGR